MASEIEVVDSQGELHSDAVTQVEDSGADSRFISGPLGENRRQVPIEPPKPPFEDGRQLAAKLGVSFALLIIILLGTAYLTLHRMQQMNASARDSTKAWLNCNWGKKPCATPVRTAESPCRFSW